jgi:hypothetical protein
MAHENRRKPCPYKKEDPNACVDFSTRGTLVTDKYRKGWDLLQKNKDKKK